MGEIGITEEFHCAMAAAGLPCDRPIIPDGAIHRFRVGKSKDRGWYVLYQNGTAAGTFGYWGGPTHKWCETRGNFQSAAEREEFRRQIAEAQERRDLAIAEAQAKAAERARRIWARLKPADPNHPYLRRKGIKVHCSKQFGKTLVLPIYDVATGKLVNLQFISEDGSKRFLKGGRSKGCAILLAERGERLDSIFEAEGFATAASIREAKGKPVAAAIWDKNLGPVAKLLHEKYPRSEIILAADNDTTTEGNPGRSCATEAARAIGGLLAVPTLKSSPEKKTDFNDLHQVEGLDAVCACLDAAAP